MRDDQTMAQHAIRVYELAHELGVSVKQVMAILTELGEFVRSASSTLEPALADAVRGRATGTESEPRTVHALPTALEHYLEGNLDLAGHEGMAQIAIDGHLDATRSDYGEAKRLAIRGLINMCRFPVDDWSQEVAEARALELGVHPRELEAPTIVHQVVSGGSPGLGKRS